MALYEIIRISPGVYVKTARRQAEQRAESKYDQERIVRLAKTTTPKTPS